ncbi:MAG: endonuclease/exonuclease/phosphatase family protein [Anaerolineales bacterium]
MNSLGSPGVASAQPASSTSAIVAVGHELLGNNRTRWVVIRRLVIPLLLVILWVTLGGCQTGPLEKTVQVPSPAGQGLGVEFLAKPSQRHIRVLSFNVGWDSIFPDDDPQNDNFRQDSSGEQFVRIISATQPDVLCLQEINPVRDPQGVADILDEVLPLEAGRRWQAHSGSDNVIAVRFELIMRSQAVVRTALITNFGHAMALVDLPDGAYKGDLYLICAHFKSQGGERNISARQEHADAIVGWLRDVKTSGGEADLPSGTPIIVLGDFNVYDTDPHHHLTTLLTGDIQDEEQYGPDIAPDWDDTSLTDALPRHNGAGEATYTWRDDNQEFNPGELDRILYTDSVLRVDNSFVLNTMIMSAEELEAVGLQAGDVALAPESGCYDHLPLVVDVVLEP